MTFTSDDISLSSDQDTNQFLVQGGIEPQISYSTIRDFTFFFFLISNDRNFIDIEEFKQYI